MVPHDVHDFSVEQHPPSSGLSLIVVFVGAVVVLLCCLVNTSEGSEIRSLPAGERRAFYEATLETMEVACATPGAGLSSDCRAAAERLLLFPECDVACHAAALSHLHQPSR